MSNEEQYRGWVRLVEEADHERENAWGKPLIGWHRAAGTRAEDASLVNPMGWAFLHVVLGKVENGEDKLLYDQALIIENPGAVVVCLVGDGEEKVGLVRNFRMTGDRINEDVKTYVSGLNDRNEWPTVLASLGRWEWELPRGLAPGTGGVSLLDTILRLAKVEALEEAGLVIEDVQVAGRANWNTTFCAHPQYVVVGRIVAVTDQAPENLEILGAVYLFSRGELRELVDNGELTDGLGLAALAIAGFHF